MKIPYKDLNWFYFGNKPVSHIHTYIGRMFHEHENENRWMGHCIVGLGGAESLLLHSKFNFQNVDVWCWFFSVTFCPLYVNNFWPISIAPRDVCSISNKPFQTVTPFQMPHNWMGAWLCMRTHPKILLIHFVVLISLFSNGEKKISIFLNITNGQLVFSYGIMKWEEKIRATKCVCVQHFCVCRSALIRKRALSLSHTG